MAGSKVFLTEKKDYSVADFYSKYHDHLPQLVKVTHEFHGENVDEKFDKNEVLLIGAFSQQRRVIAKIKPPQGKPRLLSVPASFREKLCLVNQATNRDTDAYMFNILMENKLPLVVQFPPDHVLTEDRKSLPTNDIPPIELLETYEAIYLLGNRFVNDQINEEDILNLPVHMSQLRLSLVTGIKGHSKRRWKQFLAHIDERTIDVEYDMEYGNIDIAVYKNAEIRTGSSFIFEEPIFYDSLINVVQWLSKENDDDQKKNDPTDLIKGGHNEQYGILITTPKTKSYRRTGALPTPELKEEDSEHIYDELTLHRESLGKDETYNKCELKSTSEVADDKDMSSATKPNEPNFSNINQKQGLKEQAIDKDITLDTDTTTDTSKETQLNDGYELPRPEGAAVAHTIEDLTNGPVQYKRQSSSPPYVRYDKEGVFIQHKQARLSKGTITSLSVQDVCFYLEKLNLMTYKDCFMNQMIDGMLLVELDLDVLMKDFGMKKVEALRLLNFATEGHLPKTS